MSFTSEYLKLRKKKLEEEENKTDKLAKEEKSNSWADEYLKLRSKETKDEEKDDRTWFSAGAFDDGYQAGDVTRTVLGTAADVVGNAGAGALELIEGVTDTIMYGVGGVGSLFGADEFADDVKGFIEQDLLPADKISRDLSEAINPSAWYDAAKGILKGEEVEAGLTEKSSVLGEKSDSLSQSAGQLAAQIGLQAVGVPWWLTSGVSGFGSEVEQAFNEDATYAEAGISGAISAGAEILSEKLSGGIKFGGKTWDEGLTQAIGKGVSNKIVKTLLKFGVDATGEGLEEAASQAASSIGQWLTYKNEEDLGKMLFSEEAMDAYLESFIGGAFLGGVSSGVNTVKNVKKGADPVTGLTQNEQKVIDQVYEKRVTEKENQGEKLSKKDKNKLYDETVEDMENGNIDISDIEEVLGGDSYKAYKSESDNTQKLKAEYDELANMEKGKMTHIQEKRLAELDKMDFNDKSKIDGLKKTLSDEVFNTVKGDRGGQGSILMESYVENAKTRQAFKADYAQYKGTKYESAAKQTIDNAMKAGANDTRKVHNIVDMAATLSSETGVVYEFGSNESVKADFIKLQSEKIAKLEAIENPTDAQLKTLSEMKDVLKKVQNGQIKVNGNVSSKGVVLNLDSHKALNRVVGHELTHTLEKTEHYKKLQDALFNYAKTKGVKVDEKIKELESLYNGVEGDARGELTADLVGDYLFNDYDFVKTLSKDRNLFQKIWDEIKYIAKMAKPGSKEARELAKVERMFQKAFEESKVEVKAQKQEADADSVKYSIKKTSKMSYKDQLTQIEKMQMNGSNSLYIGTPSNQLQTAVLSNAPLAMNQSDYRKSRRQSANNKNYSSHSVPFSFFEKMPQYLASAPMLIDNGSKVSVITSYKMADTKGNDSYVIAGIWTNQQMENDTVNQVKSVYPLDDFTNRITKAAEEGKLVAMNTKKAEQMLATIGIQPSEVSRIVSLTKSIIPQNSEMSSDLEKISSNEIAPTQFSLSDSNGKQLTKEQNEYFKDSKVRDDNGNLKVMYHGTPNGDFSIFKDGTYFTDNKGYADIYQNPGASSISTGKVATNPKTFEVYLDIKKPFDIADAEARNIYINDYIKGGNAVGINPYMSDSEYDKINSIDWTEGEDLREFLIDNEYDYDGLVLDEGAVGGYGDEVKHRGKSYVIFSPEQAKNTNNVKPTVDKDIRYSLSEYTAEEKNTHVKTAQEYFGTTYKWDETGYITLDGKRLDFSGKHDGAPGGYRTVDHRDIRDALGLDYGGEDYSGGMVQFMAEGNIRISPENNGINLSVMPTQAQMQTLDSYITRMRGEIILDIDDTNGNTIFSMEYPRGTYSKKILQDIEARLRKGGDNYISPLSQFRDSLSKADDIAPIGRNDVFGKDFRVQDDIAPVVENTEGVTQDVNQNVDAPMENVDENVENVDSPAETVDEKISKKLENFKTELANNERLREKSNTDFDTEIARLRAEYDAKKKKDTKVANDILRRIERVQRMKNNVDADYDNRITSLKEKIEKLGTPEYRRGEHRKVMQQTYTDEISGMIGDTSTWQDKKLGLSYQTNTLHRNLRDVVRDKNGNRDIAKADEIYEYLQGSYNHNEALLKQESRKIKKPLADMDINKYESQYAQMLGEFRYNPETKLSQDVVDEYYKKHKNKIDVAKVGTAIETVRDTYDDLIKRVNDVLREQGMKEIPYRQGYFPHFMDEKQGFLAKLFNWKTQNNDIPTDIAGLTEGFKPNRSWQSFNKQRKGDTTDYNLLQGFDTYVHGALDWIYHIEDIQKRRAFENELRYRHSEQGIKDKIDKIKKNTELDADEAQELMDAVYKEARNPLNNFVTDLRNGTNNLAGKKSSEDRNMEYMTNRKIYSTMTNISNRVTANMVAGSVSSALTNFIPITQSWGQVSPISSLKATKDMIKNAIRSDGMIERSDFMTNRLRTEENLNQTGWDKAGKVVGSMMEIADRISTEVVWRSKYLENLQNGMSENEAIHNADIFAENVMAGRSRGNMPTAFNAKNPVAKMFTAFQLEVANQYGYMFKDMPQDIGKKNIGKLVKGYAGVFVGAYVYNALYSALTGRDAAFSPLDIIEDLLRDLGLGDDEEEELDVLGATQGLAENVAQELPFVGGLLGGGRIPISSALPYELSVEGFTDLITDGSKVWEGFWSGTLNDEDHKTYTNRFVKEMTKPLWYVGLPMGGGQIKKTTEGLSMFSEDIGPVTGSYTDSGNLRFPVEDTPLNRLQAGIFGQYSSANAREYFDEDYAPLSPNQTQEYADVGMSFTDYHKYRDGLKKLNTLEEKFDYIDSLDLTAEQKNILINNIVDRDEPVDMTDYGKYDGYEEFDFAVKNPEKYSFFKENNISYEAYAESEESREAYNWAYNNPGKYEVSKVIGDVITYRQYSKALNNIQADTDKNGNSISGSRKKKVVAYINSLDANYGTKIILYKMQYESDDRYNKEIVEYLNGRDDISYMQMVVILGELGMKVDANGKVTWN